MNSFQSLLFRVPAASASRHHAAISFARTLSIRSSSNNSSSEQPLPLPKQPASTDLATLHIPVMREEVLKLWLPEHQNDDNSKHIHLIDGTVGLGGHTLAAMKSKFATNSNIRILGIDRDEATLAKAIRRTRESEGIDAQAKSRIAFHHGSFSEISPPLLTSTRIANNDSFPSKVNGILLDLGMNSTQIDNANRGFTFRKQGPLDMRFDTSSTIGSSKSFRATKARDIINEWPSSEMAAIFTNFADEPYAIEIAASIIQWRTSLSHKAGIRTTLELRYVIEEAVEACLKADKSKAREMKPKKEGKKHSHEQFREIWKWPLRKPLARKKKEKLISQYEERKLRHASHVMRCFQALRIEVNNELQHIQSFFERGIPSHCLEVGGRLVMIAFHPGEDNLVRDAMDCMVATGEFRLLTPEVEGLRPSF